MRKFLFKVAGFSVIMVAVVFAFELLLMTVPNAVSLKSRYLESHQNEIKTLILGNSQNYMGLNPNIIGDSVFNNAYYQKCPYFDYMNLRDELKSQENLSCVVWNITCGFSDFDSNKVKSYERDYRNYNINKYYKYFGIRPDALFSPILWFETIWSGYEGPILMRVLNRTAFDYSNKGWSSYEPGTLTVDNDNDKDIKDESATSTEDKIQLSKQRAENVDYACKIADLCRSKGLRLIVLTLPCDKTFTERVTPEMLTEINECIISMKSVYPAMEYYNYLFDERFGGDDYFDATHFSRYGAEKFSEIFRDEIYLNEIK